MLMTLVNKNGSRISRRALCTINGDRQRRVTCLFFIRRFRLVNQLLPMPIDPTDRELHVRKHNTARWRINRALVEEKKNNRQYRREVSSKVKEIKWCVSICGAEDFPDEITARSGCGRRVDFRVIVGLNVRAAIPRVCGEEMPLRSAQIENPHYGAEISTADRSITID